MTTPGESGQPFGEQPAISGGALPAADWYPDPDRPGRLRYWDGEVWTDNSVNAEARLPDIGEWLAGTFTSIWNRRGPVAILAFLIPLLLWVPAGMAMASSFRDALFDFDALDALSESVDGVELSDVIQGLDAGGMFMAFALLLAALVLTSVCWLATAHQLYFDRRGASASIGESFQRGLVRLPVMLLWFALFCIAAIILVMLLSVALVVPLVGGLLVLLMIPLAVWIWVKVSFVGVASALGPQAGRVASYSAGVSKGRFWPIFGRLLLLGIIALVIGFIVQAIGQQVGFVLFSSGLNGLELGSDGDLLLDGEPLRQLRFGDFLPGTIGAGVIAALTSVGYMVNLVIHASGLVGIYDDLRMPSIVETGDSAERV